MDMPSSLIALVDALRILPGVGPKSAQRMAYHLLQYEPKGATQLAHAIEKALRTLSHCKICNTFCEATTCNICRDDKRDASLLCVVEMPTDLLRIEQTLSYEGLYFVLMGRLSPLDQMGPEEIQFQKLLLRACNNLVKEVIIATNFTVEGEATAHYIARVLHTKGLKTSRIARGLPVGGELEHIDPGTLSQALVERRPIS